MPDEVIYYGWVTVSGVIVHPPVVYRVCGMCAVFVCLALAFVHGTPFSAAARHMAGCPFAY